MTVAPQPLLPGGTSTQDAHRPHRRTPAAFVTGALGTVGGLAPHVLHHVGPLVGTALVAGAGGTVVFGILGLLLSIPMLLRLRRRYGGWCAPVAALAVFTAMFLVSSLVIGPLISDNGPEPRQEQAPEHEEHHL